MYYEVTMEPNYTNIPPARNNKKKLGLILFIVADVILAGFLLVFFLVMKPQMDKKVSEVKETVTSQKHEETNAAPSTSDDSLNTQRSDVLAKQTAVDVQKYIELYYAENYEYPTTFSSLKQAIAKYSKSNDSYTPATELLQATPANSSTFNYFSCNKGSGARIGYWNYTQKELVYIDVQTTGTETCALVAR